MSIPVNIKEKASENGNVNGSFYSHGKLLITGEYLVMKGAGALALPVKLGQSLFLGEHKDQLEMPEKKKCGIYIKDKNYLLWKTLVKGEKWFEGVFSGKGYRIKESTDNERARYLGNLLAHAAELSDNVQVFGEVVSKVEFDMKWGLGSSSSLISNVAYMFDVNPFALHFSVSQGSGYDIACARSESPLFYRLEYQSDSYRSRKVSSDYPESFPVPVYKPVVFDPPFRDKLFFAYTGRKQNSAGSVAKFLSGVKPAEDDLKRITEIGREILIVRDLENFMKMLIEHDAILSRILGERPVKETLFKDIPGYVKSLGAWGGDFVLITWEKGVEELTSLLKQIGIDIVFPYKKLVL